jgi:uncharacterized protein
MMPSRPETRVSFDPAVVEQLACPACFGNLRYEDPHVTCTLCGRMYPVMDSIPVLIVDRAQKAEPSK